MTRRTSGLDIINGQPEQTQFIRYQDYPDGSRRAIFSHDHADDPGNIKSRYGKPGDILWVRETWANGLSNKEPYSYRATAKWNDFEDGTPSDFEKIKWEPSLFMPKSACRIFLEVTDVRVERLQNISSDDACDEGVEYSTDPVSSFKSLWESIHGPGSWEANPWVWVVSFKQIEKPQNFK